MKIGWKILNDGWTETGQSQPLSDDLQLNDCLAFIFFFYRTWPERTQGMSQIWCWICLGGNQRRTGHKLEGTPATSKRWARLIWCSTVSRLSFWCLENISWSVKGNILRWLTPHSSTLAPCLMHMCPLHGKIPKLRRLIDHWRFSETSMYPCWSLQLSLSLSLPFFPSRCFFPVLLYLAFCSFCKMFPAYPMINNYASASN